MNKQRQSVGQQWRMQGIALVTVMFILAIMTVTVTWLSEEVLLTLRRSENVRDSEQAWQTLVGAESWAVSVLLRDSRENEIDHPGEQWNSLGQGVAIEQGKLYTAVEDLQGRFNLNNLRIETAVRSRADGDRLPTPWTGAFRRLLVSLDINPALTDAVLDWLDTDQNVRGTAGAEDHDYLNMKPPYRAADRSFSDVSELLSVKGFDQPTVEKLLPYVTALPAADVRININTAPAQLLRILGKDLLSTGDSERLVSERPAAGYTVEEFLQHDMMAGEQDIATPLIDNRSSFFLISSRAEFGRARKNMHSVVERTNAEITVIKRSPVL
jgi:general secretion pathway protein K